MSCCMELQAVTAGLTKLGPAAQGLHKIAAVAGHMQMITQP